MILKNMDKVLIDKFNLLMVCAIHSLKRELRKHAFEHTKMPFLEFRGQILRWIDDKQNQYVDCNQNKKATSGMLFYTLKSLEPIHRRILWTRRKYICDRFDFSIYTNKQYGSLFSNHTQIELIKIQNKNMSTVNRSTE